MCLKEKNLLKKFAATLKKFSAQGAKKVEYGSSSASFLQRNIAFCGNLYDVLNEVFFFEMLHISVL